MFQHPKDVILWLVWFLTYGVGWGICFFLLAISALTTRDYNSTASTFLPTDLMNFMMFHAIVWGGIGVLQWVVLRFGYFPWVPWWSPWWILASAIGWSIFWFLAYTTPLSIRVLMMPGVWLPMSVCISFLEWLILRRYMSNAILWLCSHPFALMSMLLIQWIVGTFHMRIFGSEGSTIVLLLNILLPGVIYGTTLGLIVVFLLRKIDTASPIAHYSSYQKSE